MKRNIQLYPLLTFRGQQGITHLPVPLPHPRTPQHLPVHAEAVKLLGQNGTPLNRNTKEMPCSVSNHSLMAQSMPHSLFPLRILDIHLPTGNSQYLHEGLDAHGLVVLHQLREPGPRPG